MSEDLKSALDEVLETIPAFGTPYVQTELVGAESGATISVWRPLNGKGEEIYKSQLVMNGISGQVTIFFEICADSVDDAVALWQTAARQAAEEYHDQLVAKSSSWHAPALGDLH